MPSERRRLEPIRNIADLEIDTSKFNVHELRTHLVELFKSGGDERQPLLVSTLSFGFKNGVPESADLVFDVRFLPNPHFIPEFRPYHGHGIRRWQSTSVRSRRRRSSLPR